MTMRGRDKRNAHWFWIDNVLIDGYLRRIGSSNFAVYATLVRHANNATNRTFISAQRVGDLLDLGERQVRRCVADLVRAGLVAIESGKGSGKPNAYVLLDVSGLGRTSTSDPVDARVGLVFPTGSDIGDQGVGHSCPPNKEEPDSGNKTQKPARSAKTAETRMAMHQYVIDKFCEVWSERNGGIPCPMNGRGAKAAQQYLDETKRWSELDHERAIANYFLSDDVNAGDAPHKAFKILMNYATVHQRRKPNGPSYTEERSKRIERNTAAVLGEDTGPAAKGDA